MSSVYSVPIIDVAPFLANDPVGTKEIICQVTRALEYSSNGNFTHNAIPGQG